MLISGSGRLQFLTHELTAEYLWDPINAWGVCTVSVSICKSYAVELLYILEVINIKVISPIY